jgi:hypothetical protein
MRVQPPYVFISHSSRDNDITRTIAEQLQQAGLRVWVDFHTLRSGDRWVREIQTGVERAAAVLVIMSRAARESEWVERETLLALDLRLPLFIALIEPVPLPLHLITRQYTDFRDDMGAALSSLLPPLQDALQAPNNPAQPQPTLPVMSPDANEHNFFEYLSQMPDGDMLALIARELYQWALQHVDQVEFGSGRINPGFHARMQHSDGEKWITVFSVMAYLRNPVVQIPLDHLRRYPPFSSQSEREQLLEQLNRLLPADEQLAPERADRRPTLPLISAFDTAEELEQFKHILMNLCYKLRDTST